MTSAEGGFKAVLLGIILSRPAVVISMVFLRIPKLRAVELVFYDIGTEVSL